MAHAVNTLLTTLCERLGISDVSTPKNAEHFLKGLQAKATKNLELNDTAKAIICLDLAATNFGISFNKETAFRLSGLRKLAYQTKLNLVEKLLELDKPLPISEVCVRLGCTAVKEVAEDLLYRYNKRFVVRDISHPQYVVTAVYTAAKAMKIKVDRSQCFALSHLRPGKWKEVEADFAKFAHNLGLFGDKKAPASKDHEWEEYPAKTEVQIANSKIMEEKLALEDYEVWKERIIRETRVQMDMEKSRKGKY